jgi:hypothetical protein
MMNRDCFNHLLLLMLVTLLAGTGAFPCHAQPAHTVEAGVVFGLPIGLCPSLGVWQDRLGIRISGIDLGTLPGHRSWGVQADATLLVAGTLQRGHRLGTVIGRGVDIIEEHDCCDWTYAALTYYYTRNWFFLELGVQTPLKVRRGNFRDVDGLVQVGYLWRWQF